MSKMRKGNQKRKIWVLLYWKMWYEYFRSIRKKLTESQLTKLLSGKSISFTSNGYETTVYPEVSEREYNGKHIIAGKAAERKRMVKMKKKAVVFWITAASVAAISTVLYIRSLLADKEELQKSLKTTMMTIWTNICMTA